MDEVPGGGWYTGEWMVCEDRSHDAITRKAAQRAVDGWGEGYEEAQAADEDSDCSESPHEGEGLECEEHGERIGTVRPRTRRKDSQWAPWDDKVACAMDIICNMARSTLSDTHTALIQWLLRVNDVQHVPTLSQLKAIQGSLQNLSGVQNIRGLGSLGHTYYTNDMAHLLAQEVSNPLVRPHLRFYPEATEGKLSEAFQGSRWLKDMHPALLTPMVRVRGHDYFVFEPAMLCDGSIVMFHRWITMEGQEGMWGRAWCMGAVGAHEDAGWVVDEQEEILVNERELLLNFPILQLAFAAHGIPPPNRVLGRKHADGSHVPGWGHALPNRWRTLAKGHRVLSIPIWLYCDDTSRNRSKKWNEHYTWLFSLAGLPKSAAKGDYHIHFLFTSNAAHPLEMMEGVVEQIEALYRDGVWSFDCETHEMVLLFTAVLALLGDNPMQSMMSCHIGLKGKYFCRCCWVKGHDTRDTDDDPPDPDEGASRSGTPPLDRAASRGQRVPETLAAMTARVHRFMDDCVRRRTCLETINVTAEMLVHLQQMKPRNTYRVLGTENGVKDSILHHFASKFYSVRKGHKKNVAGPAQFRVLQTLPTEPFNPVWRLRGKLTHHLSSWTPGLLWGHVPDLDPHAHTPVEILHVLLLGIKQTVIACLTCLNVTGLGPTVSRMAGRTFVQYAGSLVGHDFRTVIQLALFSLYDILPGPALKAWSALSMLVPLIWQIEIEDAGTYVALLRSRIQHFMDCILEWTPRWFNKPKFHLLLHLPEHILAYGPAILFATESFESFNAVIQC
ncbi:hypothetical protein JB92DRAFT_3143549 [Gautieria morchelliformis]|nr:hypothetical protein JB92DRAFT_3143549 [Gautieria morchelliformis]